MAECIIARGGGSSFGIQPPPIISDRASVLVSVVDSNNTPIQNLSVHCNDGGYWYNYHTNEKGQCLFIGNSGHMNITAHNYSIQDGIKYLDQSETLCNVDTPVGTSNIVNMKLNFLSTSSFSYIGAITDSSKLYSGDCMVRCADHVNIFLGGAGGGSTVTSNGDTKIYSSGGGGGGITIVNGIEINKSKKYQFYIGNGGQRSGIIGNYFSNGSSGGTTSAFGYSATGGGGGVVNGAGGVGGTGNYNGGNGGGKSYTGSLINGQNSEWSNWGGGGAGYLTNPGKPYGGACGNDSNAVGKAGVNGGGAGGAGKVPSDRMQHGNNGGQGKITFTFY